MDKEQKNIRQYYGAFAAAIVCNFVPVPIVALFGICLLLSILVGAYIFKARSKMDSLAYNHMTYLIGTIWISSLFLVLGMAAASYWVYTKGDHTLIQNLMESMNAGVMVTPGEMQSIMQSYIHANLNLLITASLATMGPAVIYIIYRTAYGASRATKGYRMARPAGWF